MSSCRSKRILTRNSCKVLLLLRTLLVRADSYRRVVFATELTKDTKEALAAANRWTDNADAARKYLRNKYNCEPSAIKSLFGEEKDYLD